MIFGINTTSDISRLLHVISRAVRRVKFETILKYHKWYLCQMSRTNHAIICLYYYPQKVVIFTCKYFKLSWNTTALSQSNCRFFSCSSITRRTEKKAVTHKFFPALSAASGGSFTRENLPKSKPLYWLVSILLAVMVASFKHFDVSMDTSFINSIFPS